MVRSNRSSRGTRLAPAHRRWLMVGLTVLSAVVAYRYVLPYEAGDGVYALTRPAAAAIRFGLLAEFLRCAYLGLDGRSPSRVSSKAPAETLTAFGERTALVAVGSFTAVVFVSWIARIPLGVPGLVGTTATVAACVGAFQMFGSSLRFLPERHRRWLRAALTTLLLFAAAAIVWRLATASGSRTVATATDFAIFGRLWGFLPPVAWVEHTVSTYAEFDRTLPPTFAPFIALGATGLLYAASRWLDSYRRGT